MILAEKLEQNFTNCFHKDWENLTKEEREMLDERCYCLNKKFTFTKKRLQKLQSLSDMLKAEEIRIKPLADVIYIQQEKWVEEKLIDDYEVDAILECWNNNYFRKIDEAFYGNPFFTDRYWGLFSKGDKDDIFYVDNWNETQFTEQFHCYTLHHLYDHTILSWSDIMRIDTVWIELHVRNQFVSNLKNRS